LKDEFKKYGIGDTILTRSKNLEKFLGFRKIFLKLEGENPSGTMKDRASYACLKLAKCQGYRNLVIASCGNFGASFVHVARIFNIDTHVYIPEGYHTLRIREIEDEGGVVHWVPGTYEEVVAFSSKEADRMGWFNANPGVKDNTEASLAAYATISYEIHKSLEYTPDVIAVPVGNGTTIAGIYSGFKVLHEDGGIAKVPLMIAASTPGGNPVVDCFLKGERKIKELEPSKITETEYNEPLVSWRSLDGQQALDSLWGSKGWATYVPDDTLLAFSEMLAREEGIEVLPASASSLAALVDFVKNRFMSEMTYVAVLTGKRH